MTTAAGTLQARKHEFVRGAIWDAAIDLFAQKGFDETTVDEIAAAAGVSRRSFFRYFASKDDLMGAAIARYGSALVNAVVSAPRTLPHVEVLRRTVLDVATESAKQPRTRKAVQVARDNPSARQAQLSRMAEVEERVTDAFAKRCGGDTITARLLARLVLAALDVTFRSWFDREGQEISDVAERVLATLSTVVCRGSQAARRMKW